MITMTVAATIIIIVMKLTIAAIVPMRMMVIKVIM